MTKGLLYSPFATTELFYITPGRILLARPRSGPVRAARRVPRVTAYMNL